ELCVVEAMKMQNVLRASKDSVVDKIMCKIHKHAPEDSVVDKIMCKVGDNLNLNDLVGDNLNLNDLMISFRDGGATS
ncbi:hypothetical protein T484DRAFT_1810178, partial [Baffinella frigidus]